MSRKSIDKDHIRPSLSGLATEHPHGDVNYLCFTTKTRRRAKQSPQCCKTFFMSPGYIEEFLRNFFFLPSLVGNTVNVRILLIALFAAQSAFYSPHGRHISQGEV